MTLPNDINDAGDAGGGQPTGPLRPSHTVWWALLFVLALAAIGYGSMGRRAVGTTDVPTDTAVVVPPGAPTAPPTTTP